jgi:KUP system potassium uptake protein
MLSWRRGREVALARREEDAIPLPIFLDQLAGPKHPIRVPGTAVYFTTRQDVMPAALALNLKHNGVVHTSLIFLRVSTAPIPRVAEGERMNCKVLAPHIQQVELKFGFAEKPDVLAALMAHAEMLGEDTSNASFFLGREVPIPALRPDVPLWQEKLYAFMTQNAVRTPDYFFIPPTRVVELGTKVEL